MSPTTLPIRAPDSAWACRWCRSVEGAVVLDLGSQSAADFFPSDGDPRPDPIHPLAMIQCTRCRLVQLESDPTGPDEPRGVEPLALVIQAREAIAHVASAGWLPDMGTVLEHPSPHGGSWLPDVRARGLRQVETGPADVVIDAFGMMHDADQQEALRSRVAELAPGGILLLQFHTLAAILRQGMWNALRHGHFAYYSVPVLVAMAEDSGLQAVGAWEFDLYGGTVMIAFSREGVRSVNVDRLIERESAEGVLEPATVARLQESVLTSVSAIRSYLDTAAAAGLTVAGYGAASRSVALLAMASVSPVDLVGIADASPTKHGRYLPSVRIPVIAPKELVDLRPDRVLLFVPDLLSEVRRALPGVEVNGGRWTVLNPQPVEIEPVNALASLRSQS